MILLILVTYCKDLKQPSLFLALLNFGNIGVITSDFSGSGRFYTISSNINYVFNYTPIYSDAVGFYLDKKIYILNRLGRDTVQVLNPELFYLTEKEFSTGRNTNPQGIALYKEKAYITLYEKNYLLVLDRNTGAEIKKIDLSSFIDTQNFLPDNLPESSGIIEFNNRIYVALQRLDRSSIVYIFPPTDYSLLLEIDPETDTVIRTHQFLYKNPVSKLKIYNIIGENCIYVANPGYMGFNFQIDGAIEGFCPMSGTSHVILKEEKVGGDLLDFVIQDAQKGYALVSFSDFSNSIVEFNPLIGEVIRTILYYRNADGFASGLEIDQDGLLYLGESTNFPAIRIYNTNLNFFYNIIFLPQRPTDIFLIR